MNQSEARRGPGRPLDPGAHERIRSAATSLLAERGAQGFSVAEVAALAGVGKATVYRHWQDKDALLLDALRQMLLQDVPAADTGSLRGDLTAVYSAEIAFAASPQGGALIRYLAHESTRDERFAALFAESLATSRAAGDEMIDRAVARGELRTDVDRRLLWELLPGWIMLRVVIGEPLPAPEQVPAIVDSVLDGFGAI